MKEPNITSFFIENDPSIDKDIIVDKKIMILIM